MSGVEYFLAPSLVLLRDELNQKFPSRDKTSDGWIGDTSHAARPSDHNPDWSAKGIVRAIDVDIDDNDPQGDIRRLILNECIGDPRVWYVISNRVIYSRTHGWAALRYTGSNPHDHHVHVSILHTLGAANDLTPWIAPKIRVKAPTVDLSVLRATFKLAVELDETSVTKVRSVRLVQKALGIHADGLIGSETIKAWAHFESTGTGQGRNKIPDAISLNRLAKGNFKVVA